MIREMASQLPAIDAVVVGEPTDMQVAEMHKGVYGAHVFVRGKEVHSSQTHLGVSATRYAAKIVNFLNDLHDEFVANPYDDLPLEPPHSTINVGKIQGGIADNIVARDCNFTYDFRVLPQEGHHDIAEKIANYIATLEAEMKAKDPDCYIKQEIIWTPGFLAKEEDPAKSLAMRLAGKNETIGVPYGTEAGQFQEDGNFSTIVCGPGSIDQAHKPDEFIELSQVELGVDFIRKLIAASSALGAPMSTDTKNPIILGYLIGALGASFFATKGIFIKLALIEDVDAITTLTWRMIIALPFFISIGYFGYRRRVKETTGPLLTPMRFVQVAAIGALGYYLASYLDFAGLTYISAQFDRLILLTYPIFVVLIGAIFQGRQLNAKMLIALFLSYGGLALIFARDLQIDGQATIIGAALVLGASISYAVYQVLAKGHIDKIGARLFHFYRHDSGRRRGDHSLHDHQ